MLTFKRVMFVLLITSAILIGLQLVGGRDFFQIPLAIEKYQKDGDIATLSSDLSIILKGGKITQGTVFLKEFANKVIYRWKDEFNEVHISEIKPEDTHYEEIKLGDLKSQLQKGMTQEEIKQILKKEQ